MIDEVKAKELADKVLALARDTITVRLRFFDSAMSKVIIDYPSIKLLEKYAQEPNFAVRLYLHVILHGIFLHRFRTDKDNEDFWNLATDIAVESVILDMNIPGFSLTRDDEARMVLSKIRKWNPFITADKMYREFAVAGISNDAYETYQRLFTMDNHPKMLSYEDEPEMIMTKEDWERISEQVKAELDSFDENGIGSESLKLNLLNATRKRFDYDSILKKFAVRGEEIKINPDEFDYIYYTYGLNLYENIPLIEPLEYSEEKKIKDFVIAIDTSASCGKETVRKFLHKTYDILKTSNAFFEKVNIHIIQCDSKIQSDIRISDPKELDMIADEFTISGFGATDFRPVFDYVDKLVEEKEFENLKGLIYLTDGRGIYPSKAPEYDAMFVYNNHDDFRPMAPYWVIKVELDEE